MEHFQEDLVCHFSILLAWTLPQCLISKSNWHAIHTHSPKPTFLFVLMLCFLQWQLGKVHSYGWNCLNFLQTEFNLPVFSFAAHLYIKLITSGQHVKLFELPNFTFSHFHFIKVVGKKITKNQPKFKPTKNIFSLFSNCLGGGVLPFSDFSS